MKHLSLFIALLPLWTFAQTVSVGTLSPTAPYCAGQTLEVPYTVSGGTFNSGNTFTAQLSNQYGSFNSPTNIGTISATTSGTIQAQIPFAVSNGTGYKVRIVANSPAKTSGNSPNFSVTALSITASIVNQTVYCAGDEIEVAFTTSCDFPAGTVFSAQLSRSNGSWDISQTEEAPIILGTKVGSGGLDTITAVVPTTYIRFGTGYKVRVIANTTPMRFSNNINNVAIRTAQVHSSSYSFCSGSNTKLEARVLAAPSGVSYSYQWFSGNDAVGTNSNSYWANNAADYKVHVIPSDGSCVAVSEYKSVTERPLPVIDGMLVNGVQHVSGDVIVCENDVVSLEVSSAEAVSYQWFVNSGPKFGETGTTYSQAITGTTNISARVTGANGCNSSYNVRFIANPIPKANFTLSKETLYIGESINVTSVGTNANATTAVWTMTGSSLPTFTGAGNALPPSFSYYAGGSYTVTRTVTYTGTGCSVSSSKDILVEDVNSLDELLTNDLKSYGLLAQGAITSTNNVFVKGYAGSFSSITNVSPLRSNDSVHSYGEGTVTTALTDLSAFINKATNLANFQGVTKTIAPFDTITAGIYNITNTKLNFFFTLKGNENDKFVFVFNDTLRIDAGFLQDLSGKIKRDNVIWVLKDDVNISSKYGTYGFISAEGDVQLSTSLLFSSIATLGTISVTDIGGVVIAGGGVTPDEVTGNFGNIINLAGCNLNYAVRSLKTTTKYDFQWTNIECPELCVIPREMNTPLPPVSTIPPPTFPFTPFLEIDFTEFQNRPIERCFIWFTISLPLAVTATPSPVVAFGPNTYFNNLPTFLGLGDHTELASTQHFRYFAYRQEIPVSDISNTNLTYNISIGDLNFVSGLNDIDGITMMMVYRDNATPPYIGSLVVDDGFLTSRTINPNDDPIEHTISNSIVNNGCTNQLEQTFFNVVGKNPKDDQCCLFGTVYPHWGFGSNLGDIEDRYWNFEVGNGISQIYIETAGSWAMRDDYSLLMAGHYTQEPICANAGPDETICLGESIPLVGTPASFGVWTGPVVQGNNSFQFNSDFTGDGIHEVEYVRIIDGCLGSDAKTIFVLPLPTTPTIIGNNCFFDDDRGYTFSVQNPEGEVIWTLNGTPQPNGNSLFIQQAAIGDVITAQIVANGCTSETATITIQNCCPEGLNIELLDEPNPPIYLNSIVSYDFRATNPSGITANGVVFTFVPEAGLTDIQLFVGGLPIAPTAPGSNTWNLPPVPNGSTLDFRITGRHTVLTHPNSFTQTFDWSLAGCAEGEVIAAPRRTVISCPAGLSGAVLLCREMAFPQNFTTSLSVHNTIQNIRKIEVTLRYNYPTAGIPSDMQTNGIPTFGLEGIYNGGNGDYTIVAEDLSPINEPNTVIKYTLEINQGLPTLLRTFSLSAPSFSSPIVQPFVGINQAVLTFPFTWTAQPTVAPFFRRIQVDDFIVTFDNGNTQRIPTDFAVIEAEGCTGDNSVNINANFIPVEGTVNVPVVFTAAQPYDFHFWQVGGIGQATADNGQFFGAAPTLTRTFTQAGTYPVKHYAFSGSSVRSVLRYVTISAAGGGARIGQAQPTETISNLLEQEIAVDIFPNPYSDKVQIRYHLKEDTQVELFVMDALGKKVADLHKGLQTKGQHRFDFSAVEKGKTKGIYFLYMRANDKVQLFKLVEN